MQGVHLARRAQRALARHHHAPACRGARWNEPPSSACRCRLEGASYKLHGLMRLDELHRTMRTMYSCTLGVARRGDGRRDREAKWFATRVTRVWVWDKTMDKSQNAVRRISQIYYTRHRYTNTRLL